MQLPEIDFSSLEIKEIGSWPLLLRIAVIFGACVATLVLMYFFVFSAELTALDNSVKQLEAKAKEFKDQYTMAVNLDGYKAQMQEMESAYQEYIKQLPSSSNIPELLDSLTKIGEHNGLKINSIKIGEPKLISGFYMSLPLNLSVIGGYHNIGLFVNETSKLARIVTLHDFTLKPASNAKTGELQMDMQAQTYWLASAAEIEAEKPADTNTKKSKGKRGAAAAEAPQPTPDTPGLAPTPGPTTVPPPPPSRMAPESASRSAGQ